MSYEPLYGVFILKINVSLVKIAVENGDRLKPMTAIKLCWTYIYIHCWTPISIKCHFQGRSSWLKICYVGKDDGVDYLKPNTTIKMLVWYVLGQFRLCVVSFRPHLMAVRDGFEYWLFCDDLLQNITRNPWMVNVHLDKPG